MKTLMLLIIGSFVSFIAYVFLPTMGEGILNILIGLAIIDIFCILAIISYKRHIKI